MVALKLRKSWRTWRSQKGKQERRGGIETAISNVIATVRDKKQERRGGIETGYVDGSFKIFLSEAGTPWWH